MVSVPLEKGLAETGWLFGGGIVEAEGMCVGCRSH